MITTLLFVGIAFVGVMVLAAAIGVVLVLVRRKPAPQPTSPTAFNPGLTLIEAAEIAGKVSAGKIVEEKLGAKKAEAFISDITGAFSAPSKSLPNQ